MCLTEKYIAPRRGGSYRNSIVHSAAGGPIGILSYIPPPMGGPLEVPELVAIVLLKDFQNSIEFALIF